MSKKKLLITRRMPPNVETRAEADYETHSNTEDKPYSAEQILELAAGFDAILCAGGDPFNADLFARLPDTIGIVATYSVGYEHVDVEAARKRGIAVSNTPDVLTDATADVAMLCLLGAARRAAECDQLMRNGEWDQWHSTYMLGTHLGGKRLGILGMGRIGRAVADRGRGFGMKIHYHNRSRLKPDDEKDAVFHADSKELLAVSDFLSINAPSTPETKNFLNKERIALLPDGAIVANSSRGDLVDDDALIEALQSGKVSAAGLDVFAGEPNFDPRYKTLRNTLLLPHVGSATHETRDDMGFRCLDNIDAFFANKPLISGLT